MKAGVALEMKGFLISALVVLGILGLNAPAIAQGSADLDKSGFVNANDQILFLEQWHTEGLGGEAPRTTLEPGLPTFVPGHLPVDFETIDPSNMTLFYPGQITYDYLRSGEHGGGGAVGAGVSCRSCHGNAGFPTAAELGASLVVAGTNEDNPVPGKNGSVELAVKFAYDTENIYSWAQWDTQNTLPGDVHQMFKFNGTSGLWEKFGGPRPDSDPPIYEDRFTMLVGYNNTTAGHVPADNGLSFGFQEHACFITCHGSMRDQKFDAINATNPVPGDIFPGQSDIRKYTLITRLAAQAGNPEDLTGVTEEEGRWALLKDPVDLDALQASGQILDMWMTRMARSNHVGYADDMWSFDYRNGDAGSSSFGRQRASNLNSPDGAGAFMYNPEAVLPSQLSGGTYAIQGGNDPLGAVFAQNTLPYMTTLAGPVGKPIAIAYDPNVYTPQDGDVLHERILRDPSGSRSDIQAYSVFYRKASEDHGTWTCYMKRSLNTGNPLDDVIMEDGVVYPVGFAVHDDRTTTRRHFVSLEYTLGLGVQPGEADIIAVQLP